MPILIPQRVLIKGKRFVTQHDLEDNITTMAEIAEELIDLANFEMTCHERLLSFVQPPTLETQQDFANDGVWTKIMVVIAVDKESTGQVEIVEI